MTRRGIRSVLALLALAALAVAGAGGVRAAEPTLGAALQSRVYLDQGHTILFENRSELDEVFTFAGSGGFLVEPASITLPPGARGAVTVAGDGPDGSAIDVRVAAVVHGAMGGQLALSSRVYHVAPFDAASLIGPALWGLALAVLALLILRRLRPWELRVARRAS